MGPLVNSAALAVVAAGILVFVSALWRPAQARLLVSLSLEFWMAAGMLHLACEPSWPGIATAAAILAVRKAIAAFA
jgi:hypothetical protein